MQDYLKKILPHLICVFLLAIISVIYFYPVLLNKGLEQSDISQFLGMSKQIVDHRETYNEEPYWLDNAFLGMPSYQVSVKYPNDILKFVDLSIRFLPRPADYLFLYLFSFYLLIISLKIDYRYAFFGCLAFGFSTYLIIILGVGHNTKALALGYLPMVIMGVMMIFRKHFLKGFLITSIALGLQIHSNHYQMTYYTLLLILIIFVVYLFYFLKKNDLKTYLIITSVFAGSSIIALMLNATALLSTYEYSKFSTRSKSEITINPDGTKKESDSGLSKDYITEYSYGILESLNLYIPRFMGGGSSETISEDSKLMDFIKSLDPVQGQQVYQYSRTYWGNQPIVAAPAYIGASILFVFFLSLLTVKNINMRWISIAIGLSLILSWGKNFNFLTNFMIDYFPFYNKFRAVSSIQVILEFCVPLMAVYGIHKFLSGEFDNNKKLRALLTSFVVFTSFSLILYLFGESLFEFKSSYEIFSNYPEILNLLVDERISIFKYDTIRSLLIIFSVTLILFCSIKRILNKNITIFFLIIVVLFDLWGVNKRYVNTDQFVEKNRVEKPFIKTKADIAIQQDTSDYRVFEPQRGFSNARTSFFHKSIAGYHAAKPKRIQDLYDFYISKNNMSILNMLNVKYIIQDDPNNPIGVTRNPNNLGNAWFVEEIIKVKNSDDELLKLGEVDLRKTALSKNLNNKKYILNKSNSIILKQRKANHLIYEVNIDSPQFVVFSEAFYKNGWKSYVDSNEVEHHLVNYLLRGMEIQNGQYQIHFKFEPEIIKQGSIFSIFAIIILIISFYYFLKKHLFHVRKIA